MQTSPEIVITGLGVVSPLGIGVDAVWQSLLSNRSGVGVRPGLESSQASWRLAAAVPDFDGKAYIPRKSLKVMCREIQMGYAAAAMAIASGGVSPGQIPPERVATVFGGEAFYADPADLIPVFQQCVALGNTESAWGQVAPREIEPLWMLKYLPNMVASHVSILLDARGPSNTIVLGDNSSLPALIEGVELLRRGWVDMVIVGATGSQMVPTATVYRQRTRLASETHCPAAAVRPFDTAATGTVFGEGAAAFVIETVDHALARGVRPMAKILAQDRAFAPSPDQLPARLAASIRQALHLAELQPGDIGHVNANGTGVREEDRGEAQGLASVLPDCPVFAPKSYFGVLGPASGAVELACSLLALQQALLPATLNHETPAPDCPVTVATRNQELHNPYAVITNQTPQGQIATLVVQGLR
jgi:3-oxoacyl-[acyl-carrier-protein] synthase II